MLLDAHKTTPKSSIKPSDYSDDGISEYDKIMEISGFVLQQAVWFFHDEILHGYVNHVGYTTTGNFNAASEATVKRYMSPNVPWFKDTSPLCPTCLDGEVEVVEAGSPSTGTGN